MERSHELRDTYIRWLEDISSGNISSTDQFAFAGEGGSIIGSAPDEWWTGDATREGWDAILHAFREMGVRIIPGNPEAYVDGSFGWVVDRTAVRSRAGAEVPTRMTAIFRSECGAWKLVHVHHSIAVPNE